MIIDGVEMKMKVLSMRLHSDFFMKDCFMLMKTKFKSKFRV